MATPWATCPECGQMVEVVEVVEVVAVAKSAQAPIAHPWQDPLPDPRPPGIDYDCPGSGSMKIDWTPPTGWRSPWWPRGHPGLDRGR
jgi:hypothetical protein